MADPVVGNIKSVMFIPESTNEVIADSPKQIVAQSVVAAGNYHEVESADLDTQGNSIAWSILEAINGDCKGQLVLIFAFNDATNKATVTKMRTTAPTTTIFKMWQPPWKKATVTSTGSTTELTSTFRTETDASYWPLFRMLAAYGINEQQVNITTFDPATDKFTVSLFDSVTTEGDACIPVQPVKASDVSLGIGGAVIEREIMTDVLDGEGIVTGSQTDASLDFSPEIRGLATAAGDGNTAVPPGEMHENLRAIFSEQLITGDTDQGASSAVAVNVSDGTRFSAYAMALSQTGDAFAVTGIAGNVLTVPTGHLSAAPTIGDVFYAGASYLAKSTGHESVSALVYHDRPAGLLGWWR